MSSPGSEHLIDLGEVVGHPNTSRRAARSPLRQGFRLTAFMCALPFLLTTTTPAPAAGPHLIARIPVGVDASVMIEGRNVYVYGVADGHNGIWTYALDGGGLRWSAPMLELAAETTMSYLDGQVIVSMAHTDSGAGRTVALDARTGQRVWTGSFPSPPPAGRASGGSVLLVPVGATDPPLDAITLPSIAAGVSGRLPAARVLHPPAPAGSAMVLGRWHVISSRIARPSAAGAAPVEILDDVDATSCVEVAGYLACTTATDELSVWTLR